MTRGPVHEAFATPAGEPKAAAVVNKKPPAALEEMPPEQRPEGDVVWIAGYWAWDEDRNDYLWVSGCWRQKPPNKEWVAGYWRESGSAGWQWVPGFWHDAAVQGKAREVAYFPEPPAPPQVAPPPEQPAPDTFYVPGYWYWNSERYVWRSGYWARIQPGYVWVPAHYRWTPYGYVYIAGYWDLAVARRGMLYAPVVVDPFVVRVGFVYTPCYAISDVVVVDTLFVGPRCCCYYFGDYYGPRYATLGFESCFVYSRRHYDAIIVYESWDHRAEPRWVDSRIEIVVARDRGLAPRPPRTLVEQRVVVRDRAAVRFEMAAPAARVAAIRGQRVVALKPAERVEVMRHAETVRAAAIEQRRRAEIPVAGGAPLTRPRVAALNVPAAQPVGRPLTAGPAVGTPRPGLNPGTPTLPGHPTTGPGAPKTPGPFGSGAPPNGARPGLPPAVGPGPLHPNVIGPGHDPFHPTPAQVKDKQKDKKKSQDNQK
jgi:hypothetical protein